MAAPSYTEDLTDITLAEGTTGWSALGGGASGLGAGADFAMQGTNCVDKQITNSEKGQVYNFGSAITPGTNTHFYIWVFLATPGLANTLANRGLAIIAGTSTTAYTAFHVEGSDTYGAGGRVGKCYVIRYVTTSNGSIPYRTLTGTPGANPQYFGATANITAAVKSSNLGVDAIRYGTGAYITAGEIADPATFSGFSAQNDSAANRWGIFTQVSGVFELQGRFVIGQNNAGTPTLAYFNDSLRDIVIVNTPHSLTDFSQIIIDHVSTEVYWSKVNIKALGTNNPGRIIVNAGAVIQFDACNFNNIGITTLTANCQALGCVWNSCNTVTAPGSTLTNSSILTSTVAVDTSALIWNVATNPDGLLDGMIFSKGTNAHHAIEFGLNSPLSMTLREIEFSGFNASHAQNDSTLHVLRTTGTVTISLVGCTGNISYKTAGATVVLVIDPVTTSVTVRDNDNDLLADAFVYLQASDGTGDLPYNDSVTITRTDTTATVSHTAHNLATNNYVTIKGATQPEYNGLKQITVIDANSYTFTVSGTPATPATGTIVSTGIVLGSVTTGTGVVSDTRTYSVNQPVSGYVRKSSTSPIFKDVPIFGTINNTAGLSINVRMILDE